MIDVLGNRASQKYTARQQMGRVAWALILPLFVLSPRPLWGWRRFLLRCFGAKVGRDVHIYPSVRIVIPWNLEIGEQTAVGDRTILYSLGKITLGKRVTVSQGAHLCAGSHDWRKTDRPLTKPPITINDDTWVCADAFIGPGVSVGQGAIVGARAVAMTNVTEFQIVAGNPARVIKRMIPAEMTPAERIKCPSQLSS